MTTSTHLSRNLVSLYVSQEQEFLPDLEGTLRVLKEKGLLTTWQMRDVALEYEAAVSDATILLLLISPSFVASNFFIQEQEHLLKKHENFEICVIPLLIQYTLWYNLPLSKLPTLPQNYGRGHKPVSAWRNRAYVFEEDLTKGLIPIIEAFEQEQLYSMSEQIQEALDAISRGQDLLENRAEQLFEMGERLEPLLPEHCMALFEELAEQTEDPLFAQRCSLSAAAIRLKLSQPTDS